ESESRTNEGLRKLLVPAVLASDADAAAALEDFLAEDDPLAGLRRWIGRISAKAATAIGMLSRDIAAIDTLLGDQIDAILHHADFQRLEASWLGVEMLLDSAHGDD